MISRPAPPRYALVTILRQATRALWRVRWLALMSILSLGVALASTTTAYGVVDALLFPPTTVSAANRVFVLRYSADPGARLSQEHRRQIVRELPFVKAATGTVIHWDSGFVSIVRRGEHARSARVLDIEPNYFEFLGAPPVRGRLLTSHDAQVDPSPVVVSERFWNEFYPELSSADSAKLVVNGRPHQVVGVVSRLGTVPGNHTDVWMIARADWSKNIGLDVFRLRDGVSEETARAQLHTLGKQVASRFGFRPGEVQLVMRPLVSSARGVRDLHLALMAAAGAILLIAAVNVGNLQLARGLHRGREIATRGALGATRGQLIRELFTEGALLCVAGLIAGMLLTIAGVRLVSAFMPPSLDETMVSPQLSWRVFAVGGLLAGLASIAVGVWPAMRLSELRLSDALKGAAEGNSRSVTVRHRSLIVIQTAIALTVLSVTALLIRAASRIHSVDIGFAPDAVIHASMRVSRGSHVGISLQARIRSIRSHLAAAPGVALASFYSERAPVNRQMTFAHSDGTTHTTAVGLSFVYRQVSDDFLKTLAVGMSVGDDFTNYAGSAAAIVDETMAEACWGKRSPIGAQIRLGDAQSGAPWVRIVGVSRAFLIDPITPQLLDQQSGCPAGNVLVLQNDRDTTEVPSRGTEVHALIRASEQPYVVPTTVLRALQQIPAVHPVQIEPIAAHMHLSAWQARYAFLVTLFGTFAGITIVLASLGVFAMSFYAVTRRSREFGVRMSLGASPTRIMTLVFGEVRATTLMGLALGLLLSLWSSALIQTSLVSPIERFDSLAFAAAAAVLLAAQMVATYMPARLAARVDVLTALRAE